MASGYASLPNTPNFLGMLFNTNVNKTQFLSMIGGTDGANALITSNPEFPISVKYALDNPSQPAITEAASVGAASPTYFGLSQDTNVIQIFQEDVTVSRLRERASGRLSGVNTAGMMPEQSDEEALQIMLHLEKMKRDMNYTAINGVYSNGGLTNSAVALKTRGIINAITSNIVVGALDADNIDLIVRKVFDKGAFETPTFFVNSANKIALSKLFFTEKLTEVDRNRFMAGVAVEALVTDFGRTIYIVVDNDIPSDTILLADISFVKPVFTRDKETGEIITVKPLSQRGGASYEIYAEFGLDHGAEFMHAKLLIGTVTAWLTATAYVAGNYVTQGGFTYKCLEGHTSDTFATDLAAKKWIKIV